MEIRNVKAFLAVAASHSFSQAAKELGYSQSAITVQIQNLESELGVRLFERLNNQVSLTQAGKNFMFYAHELINVVTSATAGAKKASQISGILRIGSVESITTSLLPDILLAFHRLYPAVQTVVYTTGKDSLTDMLVKNNVDLFFTLDRRKTDPQFKNKLLQKQPIVFVGPPNQRFTAAKLTLAQIVQWPFILTEAGESYRYELDRLLDQEGLHIQPILEIGNAETIIHLVKRGMGYSFLPLFAVKPALQHQAIQQLPVSFPALQIWVQLVLHKDKWITPEMAAFIDLVQGYLEPTT